MSRNTIIAIVAAVVVIGAAGGFIIANRDTNNQTSNQQNSNTENNGAQTESTTLAELTKKGEPRKCTYSGTNSGGEFSGTAYFSNQRMRNNFTSTSNNKNYDGSMIISNGSQVFWDNTSKKGFKTAIQANTTNNTQTTGQSMDTNATFNFSCQKWSVDESQFTTPSDVTVQDMSQLMQNMPQMPTN